MEPAVFFLIPHIVKNSFNFTQGLEKQCQSNTLLSMCDVKSLYTNIRHDLFLTAIKYWIERLQNILPIYIYIHKILLIFYYQTTFLDDIFHKWLEHFNIKQFYDLINSLDEDLKFTFENPSRTLKFLDIQ